MTPAEAALLEACERLKAIEGDEEMNPLLWDRKMRGASSLLVKAALAWAREKQQ